MDVKDRKEVGHPYARKFRNYGSYYFWHYVKESYNPVNI